MPPFLAQPRRTHTSDYGGNVRTVRTNRWRACRRPAHEESEAMTFTTPLRAALGGIAFAAACSYAPAAASQPGILTQPIPASHPSRLTRLEAAARHKRQPHFV